jgi:hypothetical protein
MAADYAEGGCAEYADGAGLRGMGARWDNGQSVICGNQRNLRTHCKRWYKWSADYADYAEGGCALFADGADLRGMGAGLAGGRNVISGNQRNLRTIVNARTMGPLITLITQRVDARYLRTARTCGKWARD